MPSQSDSAVLVSFSQYAGAHTAVAGGYAHAVCIPSQLPLHTPDPLHVPCTGGPSGAVRHAPACPGRSQLWQAPVQVDSQHTPSAQCPVAQSASASQVPPCPVSGAQLPLLLQVKPSAQSALVAHETGQPPVIPSHSSGAHSSPSGVAPASSTVHVPAAAAVESHVSHAPLQDVAQHTPDEQKPDAQAPSLWHGSPTVSTAEHRPLWQNDPVTQSLSVVHWVRQASAPHW